MKACVMMVILTREKPHNFKQCYSYFDLNSLEPDPLPTVGMVW